MRQSPLTDYGEVVGLVPAAGTATRIAPLPFSKELYPIGFSFADGDCARSPKVVCHYLLEKMRSANVEKVFIVLRKGKWDIPAYLGDGQMLNMHLAYLMMRLPFGPPYTLDQAYPFVRNARVALGFPDIIFQPDDAFSRLLDRQSSTEADIVLGLFPVHEPSKWDMVELDETFRVRQIVIKPRETHLRHAWVIAVWTPVFTEFMHEFLAGAEATQEDREELSVGDVVQASICNGLRVDSVIFSEGSCLDIGTPDDLVRAVSAHFVA